MILSLKKYWQLFSKFRSLQLMEMTEYRGNFYFWSIVSTLWTGFNFFFFALLLNINNQLGGWSYWQVYLLIGVFTIIDASFWGIMNQNMWNYTQDVYNGQLSQLLVKPVNIQFVLMTRRGNYTQVSRFLIGLYVIWLSIHKLNLDLSIWQVLLASLVVFTSIITLYSVWFLLATTSFWTERINNINELLPSTSQLMRLPSAAVMGLSSIVTTLVLPFTLFATVPSQILLGEVDYTLVTTLGMMSLLLILSSILFFNYSIKKYTSVSG